jgi:hypothetical protein
MLRDVVHAPYRAVQLRASWRWSNDGKAIKLAKAVHDGRSFEELPELASALEDAGCRDAELLAHLRSPGPHVRGCWALDAVLGKN